MKPTIPDSACDAMATVLRQNRDLLASMARLAQYAENLARALETTEKLCREGHALLELCKLVDAPHEKLSEPYPGYSAHYVWRGS